MKHIKVLALSTFFICISVYANDDLEALYQSVIPKSSECFSKKLKKPAAVACHASCSEAVVNLRLLVNGIPQPLPESVKQQVSKCESDYASYTADTTRDDSSEANGILVGSKSVEVVKDSKTQKQETNESYKSLKAELAELGTVCETADKNRHSKICVKFCNEAILELQKIDTGDVNIEQAMKNAGGNVERLPSVHQCRLRHKLVTR